MKFIVHAESLRKIAFGLQIRIFSFFSIKIVGCFLENCILRVCQACLGLFQDLWILIQRDKHFFSVSYQYYYFCYVTKSEYHVQHLLIMIIYS